MSDETQQLFLWYGENDFDIFQKMHYWRNAFEKKYGNINIFSFDLSQAGTKDKFNNDLKNALQVNSLFGSNKLVVLRNFLQNNAKLDEEIYNLIAQSIEKLAEGFFVIFYQTDKPDKRSKLYKKIVALQKKSLAEVKEFTLPKSNQLIAWINKKCLEYKVKIEAQAVNLLAVIVENDLWQLDREIQKLANYKPNEIIKVEDVNLLVKGKYNDDIFQLMDAISEKNKKRALKLIQDQLDSGANEIYLLTMLIRQFRIFWQIKSVLKSGHLSPDEIAVELKIHPYVVRKTMSQLSNYSLEKIKDIYKKLLEIDIKIKTSNVKFELLFDIIIAEL